MRCSAPTIRRLIEIGPSPMKVLNLLVLAILLLAVSPVKAAEESEQEEESRHEVALFAGATDDDREIAFTLGFDYEYRLNRLLGIGGLVDFALGDLRSAVLGVPVFFHPSESWKMHIAPGVERREAENNFLVRLGVGYIFEVGRIGLAPTFMVDFVDEEEVSEVYILGLGFEWEF